MGNKDKVSNKNSQGGGHEFDTSRCATCGKQYLCKCLAGTNSCFGSANRGGQKMRYFNVLKEKGKEVDQDPHGSLDPNAQKLNHFYALGAKEKANRE